MGDEKGCSLPTCAHFSPGCLSAGGESGVHCTGSPATQAPHPATPRRCVPGRRPRPHPHAVRDSPMHVYCGARAGQGRCIPACDHSSPGCVGGWGLRRASQPPHSPTTPPRCVPGMRPRPHPHAVRDSPMYADCGARAGKGGCVPTCDHSSPARPTYVKGGSAKTAQVCVANKTTAAQSNRVLQLAPRVPTCYLSLVGELVSTRMPWCPLGRRGSQVPKVAMPQPVDSVTLRIWRAMRREGSPIRLHAARVVPIRLPFHACWIT